MLMRKIKELFKKSEVQWAVVIVFFTAVSLLGLYLMIGDQGEVGKERDLSNIEEIEVNKIQEEVDEVLNKK